MSDYGFSAGVPGTLNQYLDPNTGLFGAGGGTADASAWSRIMNTLQSKEGQGALAGLGKAMGAAAGGGNDANYLRIGGQGAGPFNPGGPPTLLLSLLQMQQQRQAAMMPQLGVPRASLLG